MGEPLINPFIVEFIDYFTEKVKEFDFKNPCLPRGIGTMTNGTVLNDKLTKGLMEAGLGAIGFSIDGRTPEEYEIIRKGAKLNRVLDNLSKTRRFRDRYGFQTIISVSIVDMGLDENDRVRLDQFYRTHGADSISFMPCALHKGRHIVNKEGDTVPAEMAKSAALDEAKSIEKETNRMIERHLLDRIVVLWNGDIKSSCGEPETGDIIGNIKEISLIDAYRIKMRDLGLL